MTRWAAALVSIGLVGATLAPVVRAPDDDGFPLSTFPMFAAPRPARVVLSYAQGVTRDGRLRALLPRHIGSGEVMQAVVLIQRAIEAGPEACAALCAAIAARVAADPAERELFAIRLASGTFDAVAVVRAAPASSAATGARDEIARASCAVERGRR